MKKLFLLFIGVIFAFNIQVASAGDDASTVKSETGDEECVITEDLYRRI